MRGRRRSAISAPSRLPAAGRSGLADESAAAAPRAGPAARGCHLSSPLLPRRAALRPEPPLRPRSLARSDASGHDRAARPRPLLSRRGAAVPVPHRGPQPRAAEPSRAEPRPYLSGWRRLLLPGEALAHPPAAAGRGRRDAADNRLGPRPNGRSASQPRPLGLGGRGFLPRTRAAVAAARRTQRHRRYFRFPRSVADTGPSLHLARPRGGAWPPGGRGAERPLGACPVRGWGGGGLSVCSCFPAPLRCRRPPFHAGGGPFCEGRVTGPGYSWPLRRAGGDGAAGNRRASEGAEEGFPGTGGGWVHRSIVWLLAKPRPA